MNKLILLISLFVLITFPATAMDVIHTVSWKKEKENNFYIPGEVFSSSPDLAGSVLMVSNNENTPASFTIWELENPAVTQPSYGLICRVKGAGGLGNPKLILLNHFPDGKSYFSSTVQTGLPWQSLNEEAKVQKIYLDFTNTGKTAPTKLELKVSFQGKGSLTLGETKLVEFHPKENKFAALQLDGSTNADSWWSDQTGGIIGGILGAFLGLFGALIGVLTPMGKGKGFIISGIQIIRYAGAGILILAVTALARGQPYGVYYPLVLTGGISVLVFWPLKSIIEKRYQDIELRKMEAVDANP